MHNWHFNYAYKNNSHLMQIKIIKYRKLNIKLIKREKISIWLFLNIDCSVGSQIVDYNPLIQFL